MNSDGAENIGGLIGAGLGYGVYKLWLCQG